MEEQKQKLLIAKYILLGFSLATVAGLGIWALSEKRENARLRKENEDLEKETEETRRENDQLRGENKALEDQNKKLGRENGNLTYQLGKKEAESLKRNY